MNHSYVKINSKLERALSDNKIIFTNEKKDEKHILTLSGKVSTLKEEGHFSAKDVRESLNGVKGDIVIKINSVGGDVFEGIEIYNYINSLANHVTVEVTSLAASAASVIAMGADEVIMNTGSQMMIHRASGVCIGNESAMDEFAKTLRTIDESLISIYAKRTKNKTSQIREWLNSEKWFSAEETVKYNFADKVDNVVIENILKNTKSKQISDSNNKTFFEKFNKKSNNNTSSNTAFERYMKRGV